MKVFHEQHEQNEQLDCVVAGHICLDITPKMYQGGSVAEIFRPGKLIQVGPPAVSTGGAVSNTGLPLRRLGASIKLMGKCGDDMFGQAILGFLRREAPGAQEGMKVVPGENTSYTVVLNPPGIDRMFLHCPGANDTFTWQDIDLDVVSKARLFHFGYPPLMAKLFADGGRELVELFQKVKACGVTTSMDMALPDPTGPAGKVDWAGVLNKTLPHVDVFTPSVEELTFMIRRPTFEKLLGQSSGGDMLAQIDGDLLAELADRCIEAGAAIVLIKCGYHGMYLRTAGVGRLETMGRCKVANPQNWTNRELFEPSYRVEHIASATGAGDCAIAGFLAGLLNGESAEDSLRYACAVGAQNLQQADSISGVRDWAYTQAQIAARPAKMDLNLQLVRWRHNTQADHYVGPRDGRV